MTSREQFTIVLYDISHDRTRTKVSDRCGDFGLVRFQFSAFHGRLSKNRREELAIVLEDIISVHGGKIAILPIGDQELNSRIDLMVTEPTIELSPLRLYRGEENA